MLLDTGQWVVPPAIDRTPANLFSRSVPNRPIAIAALFATLLASERGRHCCGDDTALSADDQYQLMLRRRTTMTYPALHMQSNPYDNVVAA